MADWNILVDGDSVTAESGLFPHWLNRTRELCRIPGLHTRDQADRSNWNFWNVARGGRSYQNPNPIFDGASKVASWASAGRWDAWLVMLGINDVTGGTPVPDLPAMQARAGAYFDAVRAAGIRELYVCEITPFGFVGVAEAIAVGFWEWVQRGADRNVNAIPTRYLLSMDPPNQSTTLPGYRFDFVHPNGPGSVVLGDMIFCGLAYGPEARVDWPPGRGPGYQVP